MGCSLLGNRESEFLMKKVDYTHFGRFVYPCNLSARGGDVYFTVKRADFDDNDYKMDLYRIRGGNTFRLTCAGDVGGYWLLDEGIVFSSARDSKDKDALKNGHPLTVLQLLPYDGGEAREFLRLDYSIGGAVFLSPDKFFFTASYSHDLAKAMAENDNDIEKAAKFIKNDCDYQVIDELPFWSNGTGFVNKKRSRLYLYDKGSIKQLTDEFSEASIVGISPDHKHLLYIVSRFTDVAPSHDSLIMLDSETLSGLDVSAGPGATHYGASFLPGGDLLVIASMHEKHGLNENPKAFRCSFNNRTRTLLCNDGENNFNNSVGSDIKMGRTMLPESAVRGNEFFFLSTLDDSAHIMCLNTDTGEINRITNERGSVNEFVLLDDGFAALAMRRLGGTEVYKIGFDSSETPLSSFNTALGTVYESSRPQDAFYENSAGTVIHGFVIAPANAEPGKKYPTILDIHGGPKTVYGNCYFHEMQLWASMGYAVVFCNPTGSDGRGDVFADIRGHYGETDFADIMGFLDKVISENDFIDSERVGVTGGSYGGFMTNWIIGHTNRFKAAVSQRSISNWISFFGCSDIGPDFAKDQTDSSPWHNLDMMWQQSPLRYADKAATPTLFIHSDEDYRCPLSEGIQMYTALKYHGVPARLCMFKGENHELSRSGKPNHRVRRLKEITEWFEKYLKGADAFGRAGSAEA